MNYTVEVDNISRTTWEEESVKFCDYSLYQTWPYQENRAKTAGQDLKRIILRTEDGAARLMAQVRIQKAPLLPFRVGYVQNGPLLKKDNIPPTDTGDLFEVFVKTMFEQGIHVLRMVPNLPADEYGQDVKKYLLSAGFHKAKNKKPYRTFIVDVSDSEEGIRKRLRKSFRRDLKNAENSGLTLQTGTDGELWNILEQLYAESKKRKGFAGLEIEEFNSPQKHLNANEKMKVFAAFWEDEPAAAILSTELGDSAIVLLAASNQIGLAKGASYLLWYQACVSAHTSGLKWCDLGGIDPENNPNVYQFKSRMGGQETECLDTFDSCSNLVSKALMAIIDKIKK